MTPLHAWSILAISVAFEVIGTIALRYSEGLTRLLPSIFVGVSYVAAIWLMSIAVKILEVSLTYAVWAGSGTALTAVAGVILFGENTSPERLIGLSLIIIGVIVLNISPQ